MPVTMKPIPKTYEEALASILKGLSNDNKNQIRSNSEYVLTHHGFGMGLRNEWNLWGSRPSASKDLRDEFVDRFQLGHADDMTGLLLDHVRAIVRDEYFNPQAEVLKYREHWIQQNIDPVTQKAIPITRSVENSFYLHIKNSVPRIFGVKK